MASRLGSGLDKRAIDSAKVDPFSDVRGYTSAGDMAATAKRGGQSGALSCSPDDERHCRGLDEIVTIFTQFVG